MNENRISLFEESDLDEQFEYYQDFKLKLEILLDYLLKEHQSQINLQNQQEKQIEKEQENQSQIKFDAQKLFSLLQSQLKDNQYFYDNQINMNIQQNLDDYQGENISINEQDFQEIIIAFRVFFDKFINQLNKKVQQAQIFDDQYIQINQDNSKLNNSDRISKLTEIVEKNDNLIKQQKGQIIQNKLEIIEKEQSLQDIGLQILQKFVISQQNENQMMEFRKKEVEFQEKNSENLSLQRQQLEIKAKQNLYDKQKVKALKLISNEMKRQEIEIIQQIQNVQIVQDNYEIFKQNSDQLNQQDKDYYELIEQIIETQQQIDQFDLSDQK